MNKLQVWHILLIGFCFGIISGYTWHYQATKENIPRNECTLNDVGVEEVPYLRTYALK